MTKITTEDCKRFLVDAVSRDSSIVLEFWDDEASEVIKDATNAKKWKRMSKQNPKDCQLFHYNGYFVDHKGNSSVAVEDVACVRTFALDPENYDSALAYLVLECKDGSLVLGENVGD